MSLTTDSPWWVYPRACGGTRHRPPFAAFAAGLSPRVRGNLLATRVMDHDQGSIPARAGEPRHMSRSISLDAVYPRACGGTSGFDYRQRVIAGLSPRVRGNRCRSPDAGPEPRSIPARAGEPFRCCRHRRQSTVYPRACGGTTGLISRSKKYTGLSPRVRGNHVRVAEGDPCPRSIPARAGEPNSRSSRASSKAVYPRACGGTPGQSRRHRLRMGLSPRVRGNLGLPEHHRDEAGSIPARAGEP